MKKGSGGNQFFDKPKLRFVFDLFPLQLSYYFLNFYLKITMNIIVITSTLTALSAQVVSMILGLKIENKKYLGE